MGAFVHLLGGLASGAGQEYSKQKEEERANKFRQNEMIANALDEEVKNNQNLTDDERDQRKRASMKTRGMPDQEIERIMGHVKGLRGVFKQSQGSQDPAGGQSPAQSQPLAGPVPQGPSQSGSGDTSAQPSGASAMAPPIPDHPFGPAPTPTGAYPEDQRRRAEWQKRVDDFREKVGISSINRSANMQTIKDLQQQGFRHTTYRVGANGMVQPHPDTGQKIPDLMLSDDHPSATDNKGTPLPPGKLFRGVRYENGDIEGYVEPGIKDAAVEPDAKSSTGFARVWRNKAGAEVNRADAPAPSQYVPTTTTTSTNRTELKDINGQVTPVNVPSRTSVSRGPTSPLNSSPVPQPPPGMGSTPTAAPPTARPAPKKSGGRVTVGDSLGASAGEQARLEQNPLTAPAQATMTSSSTLLDLISRVKKALEPYKNDTTPGTLLLPRIAYALGYDNEGALISQLDLGSLTQAATIARLSGSRAYQTLSRASLHTPQDWKDSGKLMMGKLAGIEQNIKDLQKYTQQYGQKYPGLKRDGKNITPNDPVPDNEQAIVEALVKKHGGR